MATKKKGASPVIPLLLILVALAMLATGVWLLLVKKGVLGDGKAGAQHEITMQVGEQKTLEVPFKNEFTCTSSENSVVSYDPETKLLTAKSAGKSTLVAKDSVTGESELFLVTVTGEGSAPAATTTTEVSTTEAITTSDTTLPPGMVSGIVLSYYQATVAAGETYPYAMVEMQPKDATDKSEFWASDDVTIATVDKSGNITGIGAGETIIRVTSVSNPKVTAEIKVTVTPAETTTGGSDTTGITTATDSAGSSATTASVAAENTGYTSKGYKIEVKNGITYIDGVLIANKTYSLPSTYAPGLTAETQAAFTEMQAAAAREGLTLTIASGYRSYDYQSQLYQRYCNQDGKAAADRYSARPGHSEHQSGLAIDVNYAGDAFTNTPEAKWLAENSWKYGFHLRYPKEKESITGYMYESWHVRYLGKELAKDLYVSGLTLEEHFGINSVYQN